MSEKNPGTHFYSKVQANGALLESRRTQTVISYLIMEHGSEQESWDHGLNEVLCEYYTSLKYFITLLTEITSGSSIYYEEKDEEIYEVPSKYYSLLKTYTKIMSVSEQDLKYGYKISTRIH